MKVLSSERGFSVTEILVVLVLIGIMAGMSFMAFSGTRKYLAEDQARLIIDIFDEARQKALNQRKIFRVEINRTQGKITLIDEMEVGDAADDIVIKSMPLSSQVVIGAKPDNVNTGPTASSPIPVPAYSTSNYPLSAGDEKITLRFRRNGQVTNAGTDNVGTGSLVSGATIYVYSRTAAGQNPDVIRAVTVLGTSGDTSLFKCGFNTSGICGNWKK